MKILKSLGEKDRTAEIKLVLINNFVAAVRETYGNTDVEIPAVKVQTADGYVPLSLLSEEEKVAVGTQEIKNAVAQATIITEQTKGSKFDRIIEGFVAVNPVLSNLDAESDSQY